LHRPGKTDQLCLDNQSINKSIASSRFSCSWQSPLYYDRTTYRLYQLTAVESRDAALMFRWGALRRQATDNNYNCSSERATSQRLQHPHSRRRDGPAQVISVRLDIISIYY